MDKEKNYQFKIIPISKDLSRYIVRGCNLYRDFQAYMMTRNGQEPQADKMKYDQNGWWGTLGIDRTTYEELSARRISS